MDHKSIFTKEERHNIYLHAKKLLQRFPSTGLCTVLGLSIRHFNPSLKNKSTEYVLQLYEFTLFKPRKLGYKAYWWPMGDFDTRNGVLDHCIERTS